MSRRREHDLHLGHRDRQDAVTRGIGVADDLRDRGHVDLHRIDLEIRQVRALREPLREHLEAQRLVRVALVRELQVRDEHQRVQLGEPARGAHVGAHALRVGVGDDAVGDQRAQRLVEVEPLVQAERGRRRGLAAARMRGHAGHGIGSGLCIIVILARFSRATL
jgi:hypothetical protein